MLCRTFFRLKQRKGHCTQL
uniref:Uncharacterized protein n=1 Tax=Arundo donax TaxID=35708 RepID=A0A0A9FFV6_ARUDO